MAGVLTVVMLAALPTTPTAQAAGPAQQEGQWSALTDWPFMPINAYVDDEGRVITYGGTASGEQGGFEVDVWSPKRGFGADSHNTIANDVGSDLFCSISTSYAPMKQTLLLGGEIVGDNESDFASSFDGSSLREFESLQVPRWYPTSTTLWDGRILVQGGIANWFRDRHNPITVAEIYSPELGWKTLEGTRDAGVWTRSNYGWWYPKSHVTPAGKVWNLAWDEMFYIDPDGEGAVTRLGRLPTGNRGATSASVMFDTGLVLQVGGGERGSNEARYDGSTKATIVDLNFDPPVLRPAADMNFGRHWADAIVLPDGRVLVIGGSRVNNKNEGVALSPEIWDPNTDTWTVLAPNETPRLYHSVAALLADGSIFVGGGGAPGPQDNVNAEVFYPPYLFDSNGNRASQPALSGTPDEVGYGQRVTVSVDRPIDRMTFIKTNNATHSLNSQIFQELTFTQTGNSVTVTIPNKATVATPGLYTLYALGADGVPSEAEFTWLGTDVTPDPALNDGNLLRNGSFEEDRVADGGWGILAAPGWTSSRSDNRVELWGQGHRDIPASQGRQFAELNVSGPVTISQTVNVEPGTTYTWSLDHRGRDDTDTLEVVIDGTLQRRISTPPGSWKRYDGDYTVAAGDRAVTVEIRAIDAGGLGNLVDRIQFAKAERNGNLLENASFERDGVAGGSNGTVVPRKWTTSRSGNTVRHWQSGNEGVPSADGVQFAELNWPEATTIGQTVEIDQGGAYTWSFEHRGRDGTDTVELLIDGVSQGRSTAQPGSWVNHSGRYQSSQAATSLTLSLRPVDGGGTGNFVDDVQLVKAVDRDATPSPVREFSELLFDVVRPGDPGKTGWRAFEGVPNQPVTVNGTSFTLFGFDSGNVRNRGGYLDSVNSDFVFNDGANSSIGLRLEGLPAGDYDLSSWHNDIDPRYDGRMQIEFGKQGSDGTVLVDNFALSPGPRRYSITVDGVSVYDLIFREDNYRNTTRLNGFRLTKTG